VNLGWDISGIDPDKVKSVLAKPWTLDNATFSDRLWARKNLLIDTLHTQLTQAMILGTPLDRVTAAVAAALGASKANASRLVRTEMGFFAVKAQRDALGELDVEEYQVVETLDGVTCPTCGAMDGKHFPVTQFQAGVTAPLFHPNCRGCISPYFEDEADYSVQRIARDEDGKNYYVRGDMSYAEWKKAFVDGGDKTGLQNAAESDILKLPSFEIGKSLGAKASNYDIYDGLGNHFRFAEGSKIQDVEVFAGHGVKTPLSDAVRDGLASQYGGDPLNWQHAKGFGELIDVRGAEHGKAEVHWFQEPGVGKIKFYVKRWIE
jgi:SPP1 gp7 family putative phage head morphogenesis protein